MSQEADRTGKFPHPHHEMLEACFIDINRFSVPFYAERDGGARLNGTGTLVEIGGTPFIFTAGHVLDDYKDRKRLFFLPPAEDEGAAVPFVFSNIYEFPIPTGKTREDDPIDVSVVEIPEKTANHLRKRRAFARLDDHGSSRDPSPGLNLLTGYPLEIEVFRAEQRLSMTTSRHYVTDLHPEMQNSERKDKFQVLLNYPKHNLMTSRGHEPIFPDPNGISGCGVWKLTPKLAADWTPADRKLVAIEHTHVKSKEMLKTTRIEMAMVLVAEHYPYLAPAIREVFPPAEGNPVGTTRREAQQ